MPTREPSEIDEVQRKVVDALHLMVCTIGTLALGSLYLRVVLAIGKYEVLVTPTLALLAAYATYFARNRIHWLLRAWVLLVCLQLAGAKSLWDFGIAAPGGFLLALVPLIAWLILNRGYAALLTALSLLALFVAAFKNIRHGSFLDADLTRYNRSPVFWVNLGVIYATLAAMLLGVIATLHRSLRQTLDRARQGERDSLADRERLAGILRGIHDAVFILDPETVDILEAHGRVEGMYGVDPSAVMDRGVDALSAGDGPWTLAEAKKWVELCRREGPQSFPWRAKRADGTLFWVEVSAQMVTLQALERALVTVRDIDESMRNREELVELNASLEERVVARTAEIERSRREMETFSYSVSHDLRTPLRAIDGYARLLKEDYGDRLPPDGIRALDRIAAGAGRMGRLTDALLSLSRLDHRPLELRTVDIAALVQEIRSDLQEAGSTGRGADRTPHRWEIGELPSVEADPDLVRQIFANLVGNAFKFSSGKESPIIRIGTEERADGIWYTITDNGSGFEMAYANKLFQVFQRLHDDSVDGIGIGLATVKKAIDRLGGAIETEGRPGEDATFRFRLG